MFSCESRNVDIRTAVAHCPAMVNSFKVVTFSGTPAEVQKGIEDALNEVDISPPRVDDRPMLMTTADGVHLYQVAMSPPNDDGILSATLILRVC